MLHLSKGELVQELSILKADLTVLQVPAEPDVNIIFEQAEMISFYPSANHIICVKEINHNSEGSKAIQSRRL